MLLLLRHLPDLQQQDRGFIQLLVQTAFLPSGEGTLHTPRELYDPRSPELIALLDPDACFPAPAFCGDVSDGGNEDQQEQRGGGGSFSSLAVLQQLGLRSAAQLDTLVLAARYVEKVAAEGDADMAVARGKVRTDKMPGIVWIQGFPGRFWLNGQSPDLFLSLLLACMLHLIIVSLYVMWVRAANIAAC
jgi:hypothetical protein